MLLKTRERQSTSKVQRDRWHYLGGMIPATAQAEDGLHLSIGTRRGKRVQLEISGISKQYSASVWALRDFSLAVQPGILGLLGPNGAGKSTLMRIIASVTRPTRGQVKWNDQDASRSPDSLRSVLGYLPQDFGVYPHLNAVEFLEYLAAVKGLDAQSARRRIDELLMLVNLAGARKRPLGGYSGGMKQRLGIAQALLNDPQLLIADEPTAGLDPEERVRFRNLLTELAGDRIVILSTHIVSDVEAVATDIAVVANGTLVAHAAPEDLLHSVQGKLWEWMIPSAELTAIRQRFNVSFIARRPDGVQVRAISESRPVPSAIEATPNLEDAYLASLLAHRAGAVA